MPSSGFYVQMQYCRHLNIINKCKNNIVIWMVVVKMKLFWNLIHNSRKGLSLVTRSYLFIAVRPERFSRSHGTWGAEVGFESHSDLTVSWKNGWYQDYFGRLLVVQCCLLRSKRQRRNVLVQMLSFPNSKKAICRLTNLGVWEGDQVWLDPEAQCLPLFALLFLSLCWLLSEVHHILPKWPQVGSGLPGP